MIARWRRATLALKCTLYYGRNIIYALRSTQPRGTGNEHRQLEQRGCLFYSIILCSRQTAPPCLPSSFGFSCRLITDRECLTRPKWWRRRQQQTYRPKSFNTSCTGNDVLWSVSQQAYTPKQSACGGEKYKFCTTGAKVPGNESSRERKFHLWNFAGTKVPVTWCM